MATIYKRVIKDGSIKYYGNFTFDGKRLRRYLADNREAAELQLKKLEYELLFKSNQPTDRQNKTINSAYISFLASIESSGVGNRQLNSIKPRLKRFIDFCDMNDIMGLDDVSPAHLKAFMDIRRKQGGRFNESPISINSLNKEVNLLKRYFKYCILMQWRDTNPADVLIPYKQKSRGERYHFKDFEIDLILEYADIYRDFFYFLLHTGLRCTDAFKLQPKHIVDGYLKLQMNKTGDFLNIPLPDTIKQILEPRMTDKYIFPEVRTEWKRTLCLRNLKQHFTKDFCKKNNINLHTFRHTYAHTMLNKGVPKEVLQTLLGHRSIRTTEIYANWVRKEELERWV